MRRERVVPAYKARQIARAAQAREDSLCEQLRCIRVELQAAREWHGRSVRCLSPNAEAIVATRVSALLAKSGYPTQSDPPGEGPLR